MSLRASLVIMADFRVKKRLRAAVVISFATVKIDL